MTAQKNGSKTWQSLENYVRDLASVMWKKSANPDRIDGVNFDSVIRISEEEIVILEITEDHKLEKIRTDVAKLLKIKLSYAAKGILVKAYIVTRLEPTQGMVDHGKSDRIQVLSAKSFAKLAFEYPEYVALREHSVFGSAINPTTGESDTQEYIPVSYIDELSKKQFSVADICVKLGRGEKLILLGDYGTGKSRCTREAFHTLANDVEKYSAFTLAINLREHWGAATAVEVIAGHFRRLGLSSSIDRAMQLLQTGHLILLLDGFDEVGAQTFGVSQHKRASVRKQALQGIRELISLTPAGVLVTGRPHYFNGTKELLDSLGIAMQTTRPFLLTCAEEFSELQAQAYLTKIHVIAKVPNWLPRKPLMFQILAAMDRIEAEEILSAAMGEVGFWGQFIHTVCAREARIHDSLDAESVRRILTNLARSTRMSDRALGRLTPKDFSQAYLEATGYAPDESGELLLARLCTLGRIEPESPDRQFVDPYIVQLLFADSLLEDIAGKNFEILGIQWRQALQMMGLFFLAQWIEVHDLKSEAMSIIHRNSSPQNYQAIAEIVAALSVIEGEEIDFDGLVVKDAEICFLPLGVKELKNISFKDCIFQALTFDSCKINNSANFVIACSSIVKATGLASTNELPAWIMDSTVDSVEVISNSSKIKTSNLPAAQILFLSIVHKIFFQSGGGRKENTLYRGGFGQKFDRKLIEKILQILVNDGYVEKSKDGAGFIYNPKREFTAKMKAIRDQLALSKDPLWLKMEKLQ